MAEAGALELPDQLTTGFGPQRQIEIVGLKSVTDNLGLRWTACDPSQKSHLAHWAEGCLVRFRSD